jgi:nicotinic acid mononucleotide adenylyltransferase
VRVGAYPGSFNPPTVAHLAVAEAARRQCGLDRVDLILSTDTLGKHPDDLGALAERVGELEALAASRPWLGVRVTRDQLLVDIAAGYDVVVMGADKWAQINEPGWYGSEAARDQMLRRLPTVAVAPRPPHPTPGHVVVLDLDPEHHHVSATAVREGRHDWRAANAESGPPPDEGEAGSR